MVLENERLNIIDKEMRDQKKKEKKITQKRLSTVRGLKNAGGENRLVQFESYAKRTGV